MTHIRHLSRKRRAACLGRNVYLTKRAIPRIQHTNAVRYHLSYGIPTLSDV
jgi:hypothetical protein